MGDYATERCTICQRFDEFSHETVCSKCIKDWERIKITMILNRFERILDNRIFKIEKKLDSFRQIIDEIKEEYKV